MNTYLVRYCSWLFVTSPFAFDYGKKDLFTTCLPACQTVLVVNLFGWKCFIVSLHPDKSLRWNIKWMQQPLQRCFRSFQWTCRFGCSWDLTVFLNNTNLNFQYDTGMSPLISIIQQRRTLKCSHPDGIQQQQQLHIITQWMCWMLFHLQLVGAADSTSLRVCRLPALWQLWR